MPGHRRLLEPCICGFTPTSIYSTQKHRRECAIWLGRDRHGVSNARRYETLIAKGFDPSRLCAECGRVEHRETCSHHQGSRKDRRDDLMGGEQVMHAIIAGLEGVEWEVTPPEPGPPPQHVLSFLHAEGTASYLVRLSCGHVVLRRRVPRQLYCRLCRQG